MPVYRKKPVEVEAVLWNGNNFDSLLDHLPEWLNLEKNTKMFMVKDKIYIRTLEGLMTALPGDYIIQGIQGELYPCKPDIFNQTYEMVSCS